MGKPFNMLGVCDACGHVEVTSRPTDCPKCRQYRALLWAIDWGIMIIWGEHEHHSNNAEG